MQLTTHKLTTLILSASLVGCLNSEDKKAEATPSSSSELSAVAMSSVSNDRNCNPGKEGSIVYDPAQAQFFFCSDGKWNAVDLRGPKGDKGNDGINGAPGVAGAAGPAGLAGANGRDGLDGDGIRLALKENGQVKGILIQYVWEGYGQNAMMMLPGGDLIYIDVNTGIFSGKPWAVYFSEPNCAGEAYTGRSDSQGPHTIGRIYVGPSNYTSAAAFYRAEAWVNGNVQYKSYREYSVQGQMHYCKPAHLTAEGNFPKTSVLVRVTEISSPPSLSHLAPIRFTP